MEEITMPELAGFDVIGELAIDTIRDMVNSQPVSLPNGGPAVYLLGGRFMLDVPILLPLLGHAVVQAQCNVTLEAVSRTSNSRLTFTLTDGTMTIASQTVAHLNASFTATVPIGYIPDPQPDAAPNRMVPAVLVAFATVDLDCTQLIASNVDSVFGNGTATRVCNSLSDAVQTWFQSQQAPIVKALGFTVVPGTDSAKSEQLSAVPQVLWIDEQTLGVFGFYRADATGGNMFLKTDSDIVQTQEEFVYNQPGLFSTVPARRVAVLLSPTGFKQIVGCPLVHDGVISGLIADTKRSAYIEQVRAELGKQYFIEQYTVHFPTYFFEEQQKNPADLLGAYNRAKDRIQVDADNEIKAKAEQRLNAWLASTDGQTAISEATPPPCGNGSIVANRQHMPDPFSDVVSTLTFFGVTLDHGFIALDIKAGGDLPICGSFTVDQTGKIYVGVETFGAIHPSRWMKQQPISAKIRSARSLLAFSSASSPELPGVLPCHSWRLPLLGRLAKMQLRMPSLNIHQNSRRTSRHRCQPTVASLTSRSTQREFVRLASSVESNASTISNQELI